MCLNTDHHLHDYQKQLLDSFLLTPLLMLEVPMLPLLMFV